jgi:hypothetical protein
MSSNLGVPSWTIGIAIGKTYLGIRIASHAVSRKVTNLGKFGYSAGQSKA